VKAQDVVTYLPETIVADWKLKELKVRNCDFECFLNYKILSNAVHENLAIREFWNLLAKNGEFQRNSHS
jgi:hypothetical protein